MSKVLTDQEMLRNLSENLAISLDAQEMSQAELARRIGENEMRVSRYVRGESMPGTGVILRIAEALDVSLEELTLPPKKRKKKSA